MMLVLLKSISGRARTMNWKFVYSGIPFYWNCNLLIRLLHWQIRKLRCYTNMIYLNPFCVPTKNVKKSRFFMFWFFFFSSSQSHKYTWKCITNFYGNLYEKGVKLEDKHNSNLLMRFLLSYWNTSVYFQCVIAFANGSSKS